MSRLLPEGRPPARWEVNSAPSVRLYMFRPDEVDPRLDLQEARPEGLPPGAESERGEGPERPL